MKAKAIFNIQRGAYVPDAPPTGSEKGSARMLETGLEPRNSWSVLAIPVLCSLLACSPGEDRERLVPKGGPPVPLIFAFQPQENPEGLAPGARELAA